MAATAYTLADQQRMTAAANYFVWQARLVNRELGTRVVEIGCGIGNFTRLLLDREAIIAVDVEPDCIASLLTRFGDRPNLRAVTLNANNLSSLARFNADSCVCLNVLEHVENDAVALASMASVLPTNGVVVLMVPAFSALFGPIDRQLGHHRRYTKNSIRNLARTAGLEIEKLHYMNFAGFFGWWINARILRRDAQSESQIEFFDRYLVPVLSRLEAIVHPPFGQSLFVVLRKP